jgi:hypothetical protein
VLQSLSWISLDRVAGQAESYFYLNGTYPEDADQLAVGFQGHGTLDPWGRSYRLVTRGGKLLVTGSDGSGQPIQNLILTRYLAWEAGDERVEHSAGPGVVLIP